MLDGRSRLCGHFIRFSMLNVLLTDPMMDLREPANRREIFRREFQNVFQFGASFRKAADLDERPAQCDVSGKVGRMSNETGRARLDRFSESPGAAIFLGQRRKGNRRRVRLDPAFQFLDAWTVSHGRPLLHLHRLGHSSDLPGAVGDCEGDVIAGRCAVRVRG